MYGFCTRFSTIIQTNFTIALCYANEEMVYYSKIDSTTGVSSSEINEIFIRVGFPELQRCGTWCGKNS
jgi:hypothetical protein